MLAPCPPHFITLPILSALTNVPEYFSHIVSVELETIVQECDQAHIFIFMVNNLLSILPPICTCLIWALYAPLAMCVLPK
jgi:hypothetical protein